MQLAVSVQIYTRKHRWNTYQVMSDLRHFHHPSPTYYATTLRSCRGHWDNVSLGCHCHLGNIYQEWRAEGTACSHGTCTLVSCQRQAIVNTLTRAQGPKVHILERLVSRIGDEQVKMTQHAVQSTLTAR